MVKAFASKGSAKKSYGFPIFSRKLPVKIAVQKKKPEIPLCNREIPVLLFRLILRLRRHRR